MTPPEGPLIDNGRTREEGKGLTYLVKLRKERRKECVKVCANVIYESPLPKRALRLLSMDSQSLDNEVIFEEAVWVWA